MRLKGIMFKTFLFTTALITLVVLVSFGILYAVLPDYYLYAKNKNISKNADRLVAELEGTEDAARMKELIAQFCLDNNCDVLTLDEKNELISSLSYPFIFFEVSEVSNEGDIRYETKIAAATSGEVSELPPVYMISDVRIMINQIGGAKESGFSEGVALQLRSNDKPAAETETNYMSLTKNINNPVAATISISGTLQPINEAQTVIVSLIPYVLAVGIAISLAAAFLYSKKFTKPIISISSTAALMQELTPGIRSDIGSDDEFGMLSKNLDLLYSRLCFNIESLKAEMDKVSELERSKTDFMRAASHELKTPLAALSGIIEGMTDNIGVYKDKDKYLKECKNLVEKLALLVDEILNATKLDSLLETTAAEEVDIGCLLESVLDDYYFAISEKSLDVTYDKTDIIFNTDPKLLRIVFSNIISNAVKYTPDKGKMSVTITECSGGAVLSIENESQAVSKKDIGKLFEPFYTPDYSRDRRRGGTGLGLYIVKRNLETMQIPYKLINTRTGMRFDMNFISPQPPASQKN